MRHFDLVIIGTGSGNSIPTDAMAGWQIAILEKGTFGGTCLNVGCIPTKMFVHTADQAAAPQNAKKLGVDATLDAVHWPEIRDRIFDRIDPIAEGGRNWRANENANVTVYEGTAHFIDANTIDTGTGETITADRIVVAAGSRPSIPDIADLDTTGFHTSDTIMRLDELPESLVIVGSGFIASEFAHVFSSFGVKVTLIARSNLLLRHEDLEIATRFTDIAKQKWNVLLNRKTTRAEKTDTGVKLHLEGPNGEETVEAQQLLIATGRQPNSDLLHTQNAGLDTHADGRVKVDEYQKTSTSRTSTRWATSARTTSSSTSRTTRPRWSGTTCSTRTTRSRRDHRFVPAAVFSNPQIASVGLTEEQAKEKDIRYVTATQAYASIAYGWAMEDTTGFAKLIADPATGQLLGAHIIGPQASTVIQPLIQAMSFGLDAKSMAQGQYWIHPAMPELVENALLNLPLD